VGFGLPGWPGIRACGLYAASSAVDHCKNRGETLQAARDTQKALAEDRLECAQRVEPVRTTVQCLLTRHIQIAEQGAQVVSEDLCTEVLLQGEIVQSGDGLQAQPVLQAFERFLHAPALMIERPECRSAVALGIEQGSHQHTHAAAGVTSRIRRTVLGVRASS
jgi:hypothetical protein